MIKKSTTKDIYASYNICNNANVLQYIVNSMFNEKGEISETNLSQDISEKLQQNFGDKNSSMFLEKRTSIWILEFEEIKFNIFCSSIGTAIEACIIYDWLNDIEIENKIIRFLEELKNTICK